MEFITIHTLVMIVLNMITVIWLYLLNDRIITLSDLIAKSHKEK